MDQTSASLRDVKSDPAAESLSQVWAEFSASVSDDAFCRAWLALQCSMIGGVQAGLLLLLAEAEQSYVPAAIWPDSRRDLSYLGAVAEKALKEGRGTVLGPERDEKAMVANGSLHVAYPLQTDGALKGVVALDVRSRPEDELQTVLRQLLWGTGWLDAMLRRAQSVAELQILERAATGLELIQAVQQPQGLVEAGMALANELATRLQADRVSLGMEKKGRLELCAMSRTAWFDRKSQLVEAIENAMEEAIDQEASVVFPALPGARAKVTVAQRDLAARSGFSTVLSTPVISRGRIVGALTLEREQGPPFDSPALLLCEVVGELVGPSLESKREHERLLAGRAITTLLDWRDRLVGSRRPGFKLGVIAALLLMLFLAFADGQFRVTARTVIEGQLQRAAVVPFDAYIASAEIRAGDTVSKGQVLAALDDREIKLERARWLSERDQATGKYREALAKRDATASRVFDAQRNQAAAQLALAEEKLVRAQIIAPLDAVVVSGDLSQMIGAPVERGKVLFELAPLGDYRVILQVDDRDIAFVRPGQAGQLALAGLSGETLPFTVKSVTSVATAQEGRNFFRVEAEIGGVPERVRPGMEGVGKVYIDERRLVWIWTHNFFNWLRISLWNWLP